MRERGKSITQVSWKPAEKERQADGSAKDVDIIVMILPLNLGKKIFNNLSKVTQLVSDVGLNVINDHSDSTFHTNSCQTLLQIFSVIFLGYYSLFFPLSSEGEKMHILHYLPSESFFTQYLGFTNKDDESKMIL